MFYINTENKQGKETIDEFPTKDEATVMCMEYSIADRQNRYYVSSKPCANWKDKE